MTSPINTLIATGGGYKPPMDISTARRNALLNEGLQQENTLRQQQIEANPAQRALNEKEMGIRSTMLDIRSRVLDLREKAGGKDITMEYPGFSISGSPEAIANVSSMIAQFPDQVEDPNFMPWMASQGVSMKRTEQKPYKPMTREEQMRDKEESAEITARHRKGMKVYDREGNLLLDTSGDGAPMQKKTTGTLEEKLINTTENIARLEGIAQSFKPEFLEIGTKWDALTTSVKEKLKGTPVEKWVDLGVTDQDKKTLAEFSAFRREAINNINLYIKEITGAQMSEKEADRIRKGMPDPGEGLFDGDSPTQFMAKWRNTMKSLKLAQARYIYLLKNNLSEQAIGNMIKGGGVIGLDGIQKMINQRDKELEAEFKAANPGLSQKELDMNISAKLKEEFGI